MEKNKEKTIENLAWENGITSPTQLAQKTGLSWPTCHEIWNGTKERNRSGEVLEKLTETLGGDQDPEKARKEILEALKGSGAM